MSKKLHLLKATILLFLINSCSSDIRTFIQVDRLPVIFPDYAGIVIPPNIAPMNFVIKEKSDAYRVNISAAGAEPIVINNESGIIDIEIDKWHKILTKAKGQHITIEVYTKNQAGKWQKFKPIENQVSNDEIDNHLGYRLINTGYVVWSEMGIYQRNLENFDESAVIDNQTIGNTCVNCHSFARNNPKNMLVHIRAKNGGTIIYSNGKLEKINTKTKYTLSPGGYPNWHPDGKHIAFSTNKINQWFYSKDIRIEVADNASDLAVYDVEKNTITTAPQVSTENRENLPVWSADGKYIYYISAPPVKDFDSKVQAKYDLVKISFDVKTNKWGMPDTIISSKKTGKSISFPKTSPDGKYLMFTMSDHGYFTIHHPDADLYLLDLQSGKYERMEINSKQTDSYHCWSSSGRWFVFSSKRLDELFTRPFFCYFDQNGKASKPFVLPQKDPEFYNSFLKNYNIPELITGAVEPSAFALRDLILKDNQQAHFDTSVDTTYMGLHLRTK
jgi:hypothetical protein